jgi:diguanylate cyclase (GGDEF)-like protein
MAQTRFLQNVPIRSKLFWLVLLSNVMAVTVVSAVVVAFDYAQSKKSLEQSLLIQATIVGENMVAALKSADAAAAKDVLSALRASPNVMQAAVYRTDGTLLATYRRQPELPNLVLPPQFGVVYSANNVDLAQPVTQSGKQIGTIVIRQALDGLHAGLSRAFVAILIASALVMLMALFVLRWLHLAITRPLSRLAGLMRKLSNDKNYSVRSEETGEDDIGDLASGFNQMLEKIDAGDHDLHKIAHYDYVTELPNRHYFNERLQGALEEGARSGEHIGVLILDLDNFKMVNDTLGHNVGDSLLKTVAERIAAALRGTDCVCRIGGDEFAVILRGLPGHSDAALVAGKIQHELAQAIWVNDGEIYVGASIGIGLFPDDASDIHALLRCADVAMYYAKSRGKNNFQLFQPDMERRAIKRLVMESALRKALEKEEFVLHYQPQVDLASGQVVAVEALIRWPRSDLGLVGPSDFIPVAEDSGLIIPIGEWVLQTACKQAKQWLDAGKPLRVSVNLSGRQFADDFLVSNLLAVAKEAGLPPHLLELELTESTLMDGNDTSIAKLKQLQEAGFMLSVDDFGTGYSSMSYLKRFPIHTLKIDRSFIQDLPHSRDDAAITKAIVSMAQTLGLRIVAEGVETPEQIQFLKEAGCRVSQGFFFGHAVPPAEILPVADPVAEPDATLVGPLGEGAAPAVS